MCDEDFLFSHLTSTLQTIGLEPKNEVSKVGNAVRILCKWLEHPYCNVFFLLFAINFVVRLHLLIMRALCIKIRFWHFSRYLPNEWRS